MKPTVYRRLQQLELRAREERLDAYPPGYWHGMLVQKINQIRSRIPPEQLLYYQSPEGRDALHAELRARLQSMSESREAGNHPPSVAEMLIRKILNLTAPLTRAISVCDPSGQDDAIRNEIHAPSHAGDDRLSFRRVGGDLGVLDQASPIVPGHGREGL